MNYITNTMIQFQFNEPIDDLVLSDVLERFRKYLKLDSIEYKVDPEHVLKLFLSEKQTETLLDVLFTKKNS